MTFISSVKDALLVARWHLVRALRTRSAMALCLIYTVVLTGSAWIFTRILLEMENHAARALKVPITHKPGAMLDTLKDRGDLTELLNALVRDEALLDWAMALPILSVYTFWIGLFTVPFLAAAAGAETLSPDIRDRSIRFELVRTGRLELVAGRFMGQALLIGVALSVSMIGVQIVAMTAMVEQPFVAQAVSLAMFLPRLWVWSLPFLGIGVACSQLTAMPNWARTLAMGATVGLWITYGLVKVLGPRFAAPLADLLLPAMPWHWMMDLWGPGLAWLQPALIVTALGATATLVTFPLFWRRNA